MTASQLVPGIERYPDLAKALESQLDHAGRQRCGNCQLRQLASRFRHKLKERQERDRLTKGGG